MGQRERERERETGVRGYRFGRETERYKDGRETEVCEREDTDEREREGGRAGETGVRERQE